MYKFCQFTLHSFEAKTRNASSVVIACCYLSLNRTATCKQHTDEGRPSCSTCGEFTIEQSACGRATAALGTEACEGETRENLFLVSLQD